MHPTDFWRFIEQYKTNKNNDAQSKSSLEHCVHYPVGQWDTENEMQPKSLQQCFLLMKWRWNEGKT